MAFRSEFENEKSNEGLKLANLYQYMTPYYIPNNRPDLSSHPSVITTALVDRTTAHGFRSYYLSRGLVKKGFWLAVMLAMTGALFYNLFNLTNKLLANDVDVGLIVSSDTLVTFPAVTVCNMSPVKKSSLAASASQSESSSSSSTSGKRRKKRATTGCLTGWSFYDDYCYYAETNPSLSTDFITARKRCQSRGAQSDLVSIDDFDEFTFVCSISIDFSNLNYWTALIKKTAVKDSPTYWIDGNPSTFAITWSPGEPNEPEQCARLKSDGFADRSCTTLFQYICKMPPIVVTTSNVVTTPAPTTVVTTQQVTTTKTTTLPTTSSVLTTSVVTTTQPVTTSVVVTTSKATTTIPVTTRLTTRTTTGQPTTTSVGLSTQPPTSAAATTTEALTTASRTTVQRTTTHEATSMPTTSATTTQAVKLTTSYLLSTISTTSGAATTAPFTTTQQQTTTQHVTSRPTSLQATTTVISTTSLPTTVTTSGQITSTQIKTSIKQTTQPRMTTMTSLQLTNSTPILPTIHCCCRCCYNKTSSITTSCNTCGQPSLSGAGQCASIVPLPTTPIPTRAPGSNFVAAKPLAGSKYEDRLAPTPQFSQTQQFTEKLSELSVTEKSALGFNAADFILDCKYADRECNIETDFEQFYSPVQGNCFVFNSGWNSSATLWNAIQPGRRYGLSMTMNIQQNEYVSAAGDTAGAVVVILPQNQMPFPEDDGIIVSPGHATSIGITRKTVKRLTAPYGDCWDVTIKNNSNNAYADRYPVNYSTVACQKTCYQRNVIDQCHCYDAYFPDSNNTAFNFVTVPVCSSQNVTQGDCMYEVSLKFLNGELDCDCPDRCSDVIYYSESSFFAWPAINSRESILSNLISKLGPSFDVNDTDFIGNNLLKVEVFFNNFNNELIAESPAYSILQFISDAGGVLGLWFGFAVMTFIEFFEFFLDIFVLSVVKLCNVFYQLIRPRRADKSNTSRDTLKTH